MGLDRAFQMAESVRFGSDPRATGRPTPMSLVFEVSDSQAIDGSTITDTDFVIADALDTKRINRRDDSLG